MMESVATIALLINAIMTCSAHRGYSGLRKHKVLPTNTESLRESAIKPHNRALAEILYIGEKDEVPDQFPLSLCQGDCDDDDDCIDSLVCFNRADGGPNPPGCTGVPTSGRDYCYDPNPNNDTPTQPPTPSPTDSANTPPPTPAQNANTLTLLQGNGLTNLLVCQGDCDGDGDCVGSLECFQRSTGDAGPPGCAGEPDSDRDYCYDPSYSEPDETPPPTTASIGGSPTAPSPTVPSPTAPSPTAPSPTAPSLTPTTAPNSPPTTAPSPTGNGDPYLVIVGDGMTDLLECQGDCDNDSDCAGSLVCYQRESDSSPIPPGCAGSTLENNDYCIDPGDNSVLDVVGNGMTNLLKCQGDCDGDSDCAGNLKCWQRDNNSPAPPGCLGTLENDRDYCYDEDDIDNTILTTFRLRLYWTEGYMWQEDPKEVYWCMECKSGGNCGNNDDVLLQKCDGGNTYFEFVQPTHAFGYPEGEGIMVKVKENNLCLEVVGPRDGTMSLAECDELIDRQRWINTMGGWSEPSFNIVPLVRDVLCITNPHHPKADELLAANSCPRAQRHDTALWEKW